MPSINSINHYLGGVFIGLMCVYTFCGEIVHFGLYVSANETKQGQIQYHQRYVPHSLAWVVQWMKGHYFLANGLFPFVALNVVNQMEGNTNCCVN